jgi:hypothetical protein
MGLVVMILILKSIRMLRLHAMFVDIKAMYLLIVSRVILLLKIVLV